MKVIIDLRESKKRVGKLCQMLDNQMIEYKIDTVEVGDYLLCDDDWNVISAIEYKTVGDLVSSMINGHMESQLNDMEGFERGYLFIVGNWLDWKRKSHINVPKRSIDGFKTKILYTYKTKMIQYDCESEALEGILMLLARSKNDKPQMHLPERHKHTDNPNFDMLMNIPGLGPKSVEKLLQQDMTLSYFIYTCNQNGGPKMLQEKYGVKLNKKTLEFCEVLLRGNL